MPFRIIKQIRRRGELESQTTNIPGDILTIGRGTDNSLHLEDLSVSFRHARIEYINGTYCLHDLTNGRATYIGQIPITQKDLDPGDLIQIGPYTLQLSQVNPTEPLTITIEQEPPSTEDIAILEKYLLSSGSMSKTSLALLLSVTLLAGVVWAVSVEYEVVFMPGTLSKAHEGYSHIQPNDGEADSAVETTARSISGCNVCHPPWKPVWTPVSDKACEQCHKKPAHFNNKSGNSVPECALCHIEHKKDFLVAAVQAQYCVHCHADLKIKKGQTPFAKNVHDFSTDHPEFKVVVNGRTPSHRKRVPVDQARKMDSTKIRLNHRLHLRPDLEPKNKAVPHKESRIFNPSNGEYEQLVCNNCHETDEHGAYMKPVLYEDHCKACHGLQYDREFPEDRIPHGIQPVKIREFLEGKSYAYFLKSRSKVTTEGLATLKQLPGRRNLQAEVLMQQKVRTIEEKIYKDPGKQYCFNCHLPEDHSDNSNRFIGRLISVEDLPKIVTPNIPNRWYTHSFFNHRSHFRDPRIGNKESGCVFCHGEVEKEAETNTVLLPRRDSCRQCHSPTGGVRADCKECHHYHKKDAQLDLDQQARSNIGHSHHQHENIGKI